MRCLSAYFTNGIRLNTMLISWTNCRDMTKKMMKSPLYKKTNKLNKFTDTHNKLFLAKSKSLFEIFAENELKMSNGLCCWDTLVSILTHSWDSWLYISLYRNTWNNFKNLVKNYYTSSLDIQCVVSSCRPLPRLLQLWPWV